MSATSSHHSLTDASPFAQAPGGWLDALPDAVAICDAQGIIVALNAALRSLVGNDATPQTALSALLASLAPVDVAGQPITLDHLPPARLLRGETLSASEAADMQVQVAGGARRWLSASGTTLRDAAGTISGAVLTLHDVTERRATATPAETLARRKPTLANAEAERMQLATIMQVLPAGVAIYDAEGHLTAQNPAAEHITGRRAGRRERATARQSRYGMRDLEGTPLVESHSPSGRARRGETFTELAAVFTGPSGDDRFLLTSGAPIRDEHHAIQGAVVVFQDVTQLYHLQREANDQRKLAEAIIESTPFGLAVFAPTDDFRCLRHNLPFLQLVGTDLRARGTITDVPLDDLFDPDSAARTRAVFEDVRATGKPFFLAEYPAVLSPDPEPRWYEWSLTPLHDSVGTLTGLMVAAVEITELVRAREAKEREAARLHSVLEVLPTGVSIADGNGQVEDVNAAFLRLWGSAAPKSASVAEYAQYQAWWPDGRPVLPEEWGMSVALRTGEAVLDQEVEILSFDGVRKRVLNSAAPIRDRATGAIIGGTVAIRDITALKKLEQRTEASLNALLRMTQQAVIPGEDIFAVAHGIAQVTREVLGCQRVGVVAIDAVSGEQKGLAVVGLNASEEAHWWHLQAVAPRFGEGADPALLARFVTGEPLVLDMTQPPNDAAPNDFGITIAMFVPLLLDGKVTGMLSFDYAGSHHDFTEQDFALARGVADLAVLVLERERLQHAHAQAQAHAFALEVTNARMNTFLGIASHELRTPITSVKTSVQMTKRGLQRVQADATFASFTQQAPRMLDLMRVADREIDKLNRFIGDLLDVTHIQSGTIEITPVPTDLTEIVREVARTQEPQWPQRMVRVSLPAGPVPVLGDVDRVGQVVTNLLTNALKYAPADRPIDVRLDVHGQRARVEVADRGPGLTAQQQADLFQAFGRIEAILPLNSSSVGLGLGLFICKTIIEMLGGRIGVASEPGNGSTFWFELPLFPQVS